MFLQPILLDNNKQEDSKLHRLAMYFSMDFIFN